EAAQRDHRRRQPRPDLSQPVRIIGGAIRWRSRQSHRQLAGRAASRGRQPCKQNSMITGMATLTTDAETLAITGVLDFDTVVTLQTEGQQWIESSAPNLFTVDLSAV